MNDQAKTTPSKIKKMPLPLYPGTRAAMDGNSAAIHCERESSDAAGAYPITPSTQMGEYWAEAAANGHINISGRPLIFIEPEGEHAAAAVTAGLSMTGLRAANFSSGQGVAYMHESLYAAVGKRLTYVLNMGSRAMTKASLNVHAGHDDYHCVDDTGFFQLFAKNAQHVADLNICAHRIAELALNPGIIAQDGFLTTHLIESMLAPERELIQTFLGKPEDIIETPTPAQRILYGDTRRRIPELWDIDNPIMSGVVQNQDSYMQTVAAQRPFFFDHIATFTDQVFEEFYQLTQRRYERVMSYRCKDAEYVILGQGSIIPSAEVVSDYLRKQRNLKVGVVNMLMFRPFPADLISKILKGKKGVVVMERLDQPLAGDPPLLREIRATINKSVENHLSPNKHNKPFPELQSYTQDDIPLLYSACFGLGSRDLQAEGIIGAVENMLDDGHHKKQFYLGIDFIHEQALTPTQEVFQQTLAEAYPHIGELAVHGSENPNLMPKDSITIRFHSIGGWGAMTTGKNLAMTLFELLNYHIKANPKYGSEKKGQPTTYYLSAAPEPIRMNCEYVYVDTVISPDPNVFHHTDALAGLKTGGVFIIQSELTAPEHVWAAFPEKYRLAIRERNIQVYFLDAFKIAREEATDAELQMRMQGTAFQGAFFAATDLMQKNRLNEITLLSAIQQQLQHKFGTKGARVVEDNVRVVKRGFDQLQRIPDKIIQDPVSSQACPSEPAIPIMVKLVPQSQAPVASLHRFWEQNGNFYARGLAGQNLADPFIGLGTLPALSALFRDMSSIRFEHPQWIAENCTGCGDCYTVCPDTAIPGLVNDINQVFDTLLQRIRSSGHKLNFLPKALRSLEHEVRTAFINSEDKINTNSLMTAVLTEGLEQQQLEENDKAQLRREFSLFKQELGSFSFAITRPYFTVPERKSNGSGGLFSLVINPYSCKGCRECIEVCNDEALISIPQSPDSLTRLRRHWSLWLDLPNTPPHYIRVENLEQRIGALHSILLNKNAYLAFSSGDGACMGCGEKTVIRLFTATVETLMQQRVARHVEALSQLIDELQKHIETRLVATMNVGDTNTLRRILHSLGDNELTLGTIATKLDSVKDTQPIDHDWLERVLKLLEQLKHLRWLYTQGPSGRGRSSMGAINATGCSSVWGSTYPYNPYPFPWSNHLFQDSPSMAMGIFEGHMAKMAEGFKVIRKVHLELTDQYDPREHDVFFQSFDWHQFSDTELALCPPVVAIGGDGAMYDIGFQNLSRMLMAGKPIKVLILDTQVYSNTGGQACTSGFTGQISDMAPFGSAHKGKEEIRKEMGLLAIAHRTSYVMQSTIAYANHMIEGFVEGLLSKRPAVFNCFTSCQPEHGIGDDMSHHQAKLAVESRAYPLFHYNPDDGDTIKECLHLNSNPAIHHAWPTYKLHYDHNGIKEVMELPFTFADYALTETRFRKHFRTAPPDTWHEDMIPVADYLQLQPEQRSQRYPYVWTLNPNAPQSQPGRLMVDESMIAACEDRQRFWTLLQSLSGEGQPQTSTADLEHAIRRQILSQVSNGLMKLMGGDGLLLDSAATTTLNPDALNPETEATPSSQYIAPWIESEECTACDECTQLNPAMFEYNDKKQAIIKNPNAGPYSDLVQAAERCTAQVIHPGYPREDAGKDMDKWIARGTKYN
ncbi:MAG: 2-oxoacid:acceptor oxidoreductase family protein [Gammaproteobacteria bacterium]|nr:2-oxoacid:acceptor oxidoreductase family protein [Gammaproteobacteria bacterium]MDH5802946.1 2-oxoacid:acceptor oxidoreductase family protein [Gammaproteobacteria bacterium]